MVCGKKHCFAHAAIYSYLRWVQSATKTNIYLRFAHNFNADASNFMKHHVCLCNDHSRQLDLVLASLDSLTAPGYKSPSIS